MGGRGHLKLTLEELEAHREVALALQKLRAIQERADAQRAAAKQGDEERRAARRRLKAAKEASQ